MKEHKYDNQIGPYNAYGHTLDLMRRHVPAQAGGVHLDLACGFGPIAEPLMHDHGVTYVGVEIDPAEIANLRSRGLEVHNVDLTAVDVLDRLREILAGRPLTSISLLDGLEHLADGRPLLRAISALLKEHDALAITSVPNVTHFDVTIKALLGQWEYTESGLLDRTHVQLFSETSLRELMAECGLHVFDDHDVIMARSDQYFPDEHVALSDATTLSAFLRAVRNDTEPRGLVNQFVWALHSAPEVSMPATEELDRPFLSVIMRTQGARPTELREALLCLAAQTNQDFELIIIAHRTDIPEQIQVEQIILDQEPDFRERIRLLLLDHGNRASPLNLGMEQARGRYLAALDDDDLVMANWVEAFARAVEKKPGQTARTQVLVQNFVAAEVLGQPVTRAVNSPSAPYDEEFFLYRHLFQNQTPIHGYAFPRSVITDLGLRYDESLTTTEDWDLLLRAASLTGVADTGTPTAFYRVFVRGESSRTAHKAAEWGLNESAVIREISSRPLLLPAGESVALRDDLQRLHELEQENQRLKERIRRLRQGELGRAEAHSGLASTGRIQMTFRNSKLKQALRPRTRLRQWLGRNPADKRRA